MGKIKELLPRFEGSTALSSVVEEEVFFALDVIFYGLILIRYRVEMCLIDE